MADEDETIPEDDDATPKSRGPMKLLGGVVGLIGAGTMLAMMAMPGTTKTPTFQGPGVHVFFPEGEIVGNPLDDNFSRYAKFAPSCQFFAYDLAYPETRRKDPMYERRLRDQFQSAISQSYAKDIVNGAGKDAFAAELEEIAEPILFPVHLGETVHPYDLHGPSGLRLGDRQEREGTFRGAFHEHSLTVDIDARTLQLGDGPAVEFQERDRDVIVEAGDGTKIYVDTTDVVSGFVGEVPVGVMGRIRSVVTGEIMVQ